jgi:uncharacterized protein YaiI (UPF0178 family)
MNIWIDGDACPRIIKEVLFRAAIRTQTTLILVANHASTVPASPYIKKQQVGRGLDMVDHHIVEQVMPGDLVITADIPFADAVVTRGAFALNPRGELYSRNNIKQLLSLRNINESIRSYQPATGGPSPLSNKDIQLFSNNLDKFLAKHHKGVR